MCELCRKGDELAQGSSGKESRFRSKLRHLLGKSDENDRKLLLHMVQKMARR
jgi:hypothetical protein